MTDDETGFEFEEEGAEGKLGEGAVFGEGQEESPEPAGPEKDAREAVRLNKAPWINRRLIFITLAGVAAVTMVISIAAPGKSGKKNGAARTKNAPEVAVPDFGDYQGRAYRAETESYPEAVEYTPEEEPPYAPPPWQPPQQQQQRPAQNTAPSSGRNPAAEAEYAARSSSLVPRIEGRFFGLAPGEYAAAPAQAQGGILSPEEYLQNRTAALAAELYAGAQPARPAQAAYGGGTSYENQNMQGSKQAFYQEGRGGDVSGSYIGENTVWNGTIIPGVLTTGINTDLPGDVQARVTVNIYDSLTGQKLLIPQGTILIASYNSSVSFAQSRVQIGWNTLIRPDGYQVELGNMNGVDQSGFSGTKGQINEHLFQYVKAAGIISAFTLLNGEISYNSASVNNPALQNLIATNQGIVNQMAAGIINRALDIQPTITVKNGTQINVMVNKNIRLPPLEDYAVAGPYRRNR